MSTSNRSRRFVLLPPRAPGPPPQTSAASPREAIDAVERAHRAVDEVMAAAESIAPAHSAGGRPGHSLHELDDLLARAPAEFDEASFESLEQVLDDVFAQEIPASIPLPSPVQAVMAPQPGATRMDDPVASRPSIERRVRSGTRENRAPSPEDSPPRRSRDERARAFAAALAEDHAAYSHQPPDSGSGVVKSAPIGASFTRFRRARHRAVVAAQAMLEFLSGPMRIVPPRYRVFVNVLALSLAAWVPIVWCLAMIVRAASE